MNATLIKAIFNILINYLTYYYLERFETIKCECGYDIRRDISKVMMLTSYLIIIGKVLFPDVPMAASMFVFVYMLVFDVVFISYIFSLKRKKCLCNDAFVDQTTNVMYMYYTLLAFVVMFTISVTLIFTPIFSLSLRNK